MEINGEKVIGDVFGYDGCHKIYICEDSADVEELTRYGYEICPISDLPIVWGETCPLRFIENVKLDKTYVPQCADVVEFLTDEGEIITFNYVED